MNENPAPPVETPSAPPADPPSAPAAPPAAELVARGVVRSERELQLERELATERQGREGAEARARKAEFDAAEKERLAQELIEQTRARPDLAPKPPKARRFGPMRIFTSDED